MLKNIKGMNDIIPPDSSIWKELENRILSVIKNYGFQYIQTPILEPTELFKRTLGSETDIVSKEMYSFVDDLNNDNLSLRPEGTASVVRSCIQHSLTYDQSPKFFYSGPMFRHERPQKGRSRQFHQIGIEAIGLEYGFIDVELIQIFNRIKYDLSLKDLQLKINTIGDIESRNQYQKKLKDYFLDFLSDLDDESKNTIEKNPLRLLDSKKKHLSNIINGAPKLFDFLNNKSREGFDFMLKQLDFFNIDYVIDYKLVRGLDYYNEFVFEWVTQSLGSQSAVCAGGRYDGLFEVLGGKPTKACGFAIGLERLFELVKLEGQLIKFKNNDIYLVFEELNSQIIEIVEKIRDIGFNVLLDKSGGKFQKQFKRANNLNFKYAIIIGQEELEKNFLSIKNLITGKQVNSSIEKLSNEII
jgi:histidyl-tRNA synthetase